MNKPNPFGDGGHKDYSTPSRLNPTSKKLIKHYFEIYHSHLSNHLTIIQTANKFNIAYNTAKEILKWAIQQADMIDPNAQLSKMLDKITLRQQRIEEEFKGELTIEEKLMLWKEQRANDLLESKISGLITTSPIINLADNRQLRVVKAEGFQRRGQEKIIEIKEDHIAE